MRLTANSVTPIVKLIRERKLRIDPRFVGELSRLYDNAGLRMHYFDKRRHSAPNNPIKGLRSAHGGRGANTVLAAFR